MKPVALVGGGGSGIGRAIARRLADDGMTVVISGRRPDVLASTAADLNADIATGAPRVLWGAGDVTVAGETTEVVRVARREAGEIDVLVLNAGGPPPTTVLAAEEAAWHEAFELLLLGPLRLAKDVLPVMAERGWGRVVLITSAIVRQPVPDLGLSVVLRSAATAMAKLLSLEYAGSGVTINCVAPGPTVTGRRTQILEARAARESVGLACAEAADVSKVPVGRAGRAEEVAAAVGWLVSDAAAFVNGTVLTVDGGLTALVTT
jgi:3-oxoacyl-[acyl-carrier protein] reductase